MRFQAQVAVLMGGLLAGCDTGPDAPSEVTPSPQDAPAAEPASTARPDPDAWIPAAHRSWTHTHAVEHDLDGDGKADRALVLTGPKRDDMGPDRLLLVGLQRPGGIQLVLSTACIALCTSCGGMMGDPYVGLTQVGTQSLKVSNHGGSAWRWSADYTLAWRQEQMMVVGYDSMSFHTGKPDDVKTTSINLLSGKASVNSGPLVRHSLKAMAGDDCTAVDALGAAQL